SSSEPVGFLYQAPELRVAGTPLSPDTHSGGCTGAFGRVATHPEGSWTPAGNLLSMGEAVEPVVGALSEELDSPPQAGPPGQQPLQAPVDQLIVEGEQGSPGEDGGDALDAGQHQAGHSHHDQHPAQYEEADADDQGKSRTGFRRGKLGWRQSHFEALLMAGGSWR